MELMLKENKKSIFYGDAHFPLQKRVWVNKFLMISMKRDENSGEMKKRKERNDKWGNQTEVKNQWWKSDLANTFFLHLFT